MSQNLVVFCCLVATASFAGAADPVPARAGKRNYGRPYEPPTRSALLPLPPGAVEPDGWLRDWCLTARDGYTGHMDEVDPAFQHAWAADYRMTGDQLTFWDRGSWPYEGGGYWFEGLTKLAYVLHDEALLRKVKSRIEVVANNRAENGVLFMWWLDKNKPEDLEAATRNAGGEANAWPIWANGLMGRTLVGYYAGSGDKRVLKALETAYSNNRDWVDSGWAMSNTWPAFETYTWTGNKEIKDSLTALFAEEGSGKRERSWNRYRRLPGGTLGAEEADHGVHFCESTTPWALGYLWTGRREFLDAALGWHDLIERDCMQPTGVPVFDEFYGPTGAFRGTETCAVAAYLWSQTLLLSISGQARLADRIERAFFNAAPATVARDFKTHVYLHSPNRMADKSLPAAGQFSFQAKHHPLCCTAALNRFVPNYVMHMWMATHDNGLAAACYGPCKVSALAADRVPVELVCRTHYPFSEAIEITVKPARDASFPLLLRIPGWCNHAELKVNGSDMNALADANGFVRVERRWKPGDKVLLRFPVFPRVITGRDTNAKDAPYASVALGPLLFALPIPDTQDANMPDPAAKWRFALDLNADRPGTDITVERRPMPDTWRWPLESPLKLRVSAASFDWEPTLDTPLPPEPFGKKGPGEQINLIPYGCTKFRVSMFPVTERTFTCRAEVGERKSMRYNRAGRASGEDSFTIAVAPDLQQEVLDAKDTRLTKRFQWLVDNRQTLNLKCVLQVGDFMNWDTPDHIQYERASAAVKILDEAGLPFVFAIGNHDTQATGGTPERPGGSARPGNTHDNQRNTTVYNRYFPLARFKALGGVYEPGKIMQTYHDSVTNPVRLFTIDTKEGSIKSRVFCPSTGKDKTDGSALEIKGVNWVPATAAPWTKQRAG